MFVKTCVATLQTLGFDDSTAVHQQMKAKRLNGRKTLVTAMPQHLQPTSDHLQMVLLGPQPERAKTGVSDPGQELLELQLRLCHPEGGEGQGQHTPHQIG